MLHVWSMLIFWVLHSRVG